MPNKPKNISGQRFGRLIVLESTNDRKPNGSIVWRCLCDCGNITLSISSELKRGNKKSCGCLSKEVAAITAKTKATHGMYLTRTYSIWANLIQRCTNVKSKHYLNYGAKGITVCDKWLKFEGFLEDMGEVPEGDYSIDRINNSDGYYLSNCRWATRAEQNRNHSRNLYITWSNETRVITDWAKELKININTLKNRIKKGWDLNKVFTTPVKKMNRRKKKSHLSVVSGGNSCS